MVPGLLLPTPEPSPSCIGEAAPLRDRTVVAISRSDDFLMEPHRCRCRHQVLRSIQPAPSAPSAVPIPHSRAPHAGPIPKAPTGTRPWRTAKVPRDRSQLLPCSLSWLVLGPGGKHRLIVQNVGHRAAERKEGRQRSARLHQEGRPEAPHGERLWGSSALEALRDQCGVSGRRTRLTALRARGTVSQKGSNAGWK